MSSFILVPGAGGMAWYWHRVVSLIRAAGHNTVAVDLPSDDKRCAGLPTYTDIVVRAIAGQRDAILVAQSLAGFTAPLVCTRATVRMLVFVNAMIPMPGETAGAWWEDTGAIMARKEAAVRRGYAPDFDLATYFLHDVPQDVLRTAPQPRDQADTVFNEPCRFERWPNIPIQVLAGTEDRFFPVEFQRTVARERLGLEVEAITGGHLIALSNAAGLTERLLAYEHALAS